MSGIADRANSAVISPRFTIGRVLLESFRFIARNPLKCLLLAVVMVPLTLIPPVIIDIDQAWFVHNGDWLYGVLSDGTGILIGLLTTAALALPVARFLRGQRIEGRELFSWLGALGRLFLGSPALWLGPIIGSVIANYLYVDRPDEYPLVLLAWFVTTVVALLLAACLGLFTPIVVLEGVGPYAALVRSWRLSRGRRWRILGLYLIMYVVSVVALVALTIVFQMTDEPSPVHADDWVRSALVYAPLNLLSVIFAVVVTTLYHHLRVEDEGMDSARAVTAFE